MNQLSRCFLIGWFPYSHDGAKGSALIAASAGDHESAIISSMATALRPSLGPGDISPRATRKTKAHVASACVNCKKKHLRCDDSRPCRSCVQSGKEVSGTIESGMVGRMLTMLHRRHASMSSTKSVGVYQ